MNYYPREVIISGIRNRNNEIIRWLNMRVYGYLELFILQRQGTPIDVMDVFQDGLLALFEKIYEADFLPETNIPEYLYGICRFLWYKHYRKNHLFIDVPDHIKEAVAGNLDYDFPVFSDRQELKYILYLRYMDTLDVRCKDLLDLYGKNLRGDEIMQRMRLISRGYVYKKKFECLRKLMLKIRKDPDYIYL